MGAEIDGSTSLVLIEKFGMAGGYTNNFGLCTKIRRTSRLSMLLKMALQTFFLSHSSLMALVLVCLVQIWAKVSSWTSVCPISLKKFDIRHHSNGTSALLSHASYPCWSGPLMLLHRQQMNACGPCYYYKQRPVSPCPSILSWTRSPAQSPLQNILWPTHSKHFLLQ